VKSQRKAEDAIAGSLCHGIYKNLVIIFWPFYFTFGFRFLKN
jgi:hypothetical protein